jgi:ribonucleoside-diphosphate reductase beta chain
LSKENVKEYIKQRFNESVEMVGGKKVFDIDTSKITSLKWFEDEIHAEVNTDFFHKKPVTYSKNAKPTTAEDLF